MSLNKPCGPKPFNTIMCTPSTPSRASLSKAFRTPFESVWDRIRTPKRPPHSETWLFTRPHWGFYRLRLIIGTKIVKKHDQPGTIVANVATTVTVKPIMSPVSLGHQVRPRMVVPKHTGPGMLMCTPCRIMRLMLPLWTNLRPHRVPPPTQTVCRTIVSALAQIVRHPQARPYHRPFETCWSIHANGIMEIGPPPSE